MPLSVVKEANRYVKDFHAAENAIEGNVIGWCWIYTTRERYGFM